MGPSLSFLFACAPVATTRRSAFAMPLLCTALLLANGASAQERGAPIQVEGVEGGDSDQPPGGDAGYDDGGGRSRRARRYREADSQSDGDLPPPRREASSRARTSAPAQDGSAPQRVRRRADFDGIDWDAPGPVEVEQPGAISGAFRLSVELSLLDLEATTLETPSALTVGTDISSATYGLTKGGGAGVLLGVGLSNRFVLNGRLLLANTHMSQDARAGDQMRFQLISSLEYVLGQPTTRVRVFFALAAGLMLGDTPPAPVPLNDLSFLLGGQMGAHLFPARHVSIDPALLVAYRFGTASVDAGYASSFGISAEDYTLSGIVLLLTLGVSYWS